MADQLSIHDKVYRGADRQALPVDILAGFEFVQAAVVHDIFEAYWRDSGEEGVLLSHLGQGGRKLRISVIHLFFVLYDEIADS